MQPNLPRVYLASPLRHAAMWRNWSTGMTGTIDIVSTWHNSPNVEKEELDVHLCRAGWNINKAQILHKADHLLVYANTDDKPNGTFVEIGLALSQNILIYLVGDYAFGTWRYLRHCQSHATLHDALMSITGASAPEGVAL